MRRQSLEECLVCLYNSNITVRVLHQVHFVAEEPNSMVTVSCVEPILTTTAPIYYTKAQEEYSDGGGSFSNSGLIFDIITQSLLLA